MRTFATAGLAVLLCGCASPPFGAVATQAGLGSAQQVARAPRTHEDLLAAYWETPYQTAAWSNGPFYKAPRDDPQGFPRSTDSEDQMRQDAERIDRENAATRVRLAGRR